MLVAVVRRLAFQMPVIVRRIVAAAVVPVLSMPVLVLIVPVRMLARHNTHATPAER